jgi:hypothetical protein
LHFFGLDRSEALPCGALRRVFHPPDALTEGTPALFRSPFANPKRGKRARRTLTIPGGQLRRLAELGYLERVDDPVAQVRALEAFLFDSLQ